MTIDYYREYGALFEFSGFCAISATQCSELDRVLVQACLDAGFAVGGSLASGHVEVISDRSSGFPDVYLEVTGERRLLACKLRAASDKAWTLVKRVIRAQSKLSPAPIEAE